MSNEDTMWSWINLREAGVIDPLAPWPFPVEFGGCRPCDIDDEGGVCGRHECPRCGDF